MVVGGDYGLEALFVEFSQSSYFIIKKDLRKVMWYLGLMGEKPASLEIPLLRPQQVNLAQVWGGGHNL